MATRYEETGIRMVTLASEETIGKYSFWQHSYDPDEHDRVRRVFWATEAIAAARIGRHIFKLRGEQEGGLWTLYCHERMEDQVVLWRYTGKYTQEAMRQFAAGWELIYTAR